MTSSDEASMTSGYARYLAAKTTVDDRALNQHVVAELRRLMPAGAPRVLEVGAGLGTMVARLMDWGVVGTGHGFCATIANLRTRPLPSQSLHS